MERYIRVVFFLQQIVTELLKKYLESKYLPDDFQTFLLKQRHSLFHLYIQKPCCACGNNINLSRTRVINEVQFNKLYVSGNNVCSVRKRHSCIYSASSNVKVSELDITLTIAILKNCFTTSLTQQEKDWLDDIRKIRNEISHLTITNDISENDFNRMWLTLDNSTINLANVFQPKNSNDIKLRIQQLKKREVLASKNDCMECLQQILLWKSNDENMNENLKKILEQLERMEAPVAKTGLLAIQIQQSTFTYKYGSQVVIPCVITVSDSIITNVYWERYSNNGKIKIKNGDSRYQGITPTTPSLIINCVALEDAGVYMCHVENANGNHTSYPVTITVYGGPPAIQIQTNICTHTCGSQAIIPCTISSDSIITNVYWEKRSYNDTVIIKNGDSRYQGISPTSPSLIIRCVALNDAGIYICHVQNTAGTNTSSPVTLNVNGGLLNISITPVEAYITPGNKHTIQCTVFGKPMATSVEWRFTPNGGNEQTLNISAWDWKYTGGSTQNPSLTINNFQPIDAGSYVCYVSNDVGKYSCKHPSVLKYRQPLGVSVEPAEGNIIIGHNHTIQCTVTGIATATSIKWLFTPNGGNQQSLNIGGRDGKYTGGSTQNPSLTVNNFQPVDEGSYVCCVSNASGKSYSCHTVLKCTRPLDTSISPAEACSIPGNNHTVKCYPFKTSKLIGANFPGKRRNQQSLNIGGLDGKHTGSSTQNPSLTINNFQSIDAGPLCVSVEPAEGNIIIGHNHTIQCTVTEIATATSIKWLFTPNGGNQQSLNIGGRDGKYTGGSTQNPSLTVNNFQPVDAGSYVCCASNASGKSYSCHTVLKCTRLLDTSISPAEACIIPGKNHTVQHIPFKTGKLTGAYFPGKRSNQQSLNIGGLDGKHTGSSTPNPSLTINNVQSIDAGPLCVSVEPAEGNIIIGHNHTIQCTVTGIATATSIKWLFTPNGGNQQSLNIGGRDGKYTGGSTQNPSLTVNNFQPVDAGSYVCCASNASGKSYSCHTVLKCTRPLDTSKSPAEACIIPGNNHTVKCCPCKTGKLIWVCFPGNRSNRQSLNIGGLDGKHTGSSTPNPSLTINNFQSIDAGSYVCYVSSDVGKYSCKHPSVLNYRRPLGVSVDPAEGNIILGHNHTIQCTVTGIATATSIKWLFTPNGGNQQSLNIGGRDGKYTGGSTQNPSLTVNNFQPADGGSYVCCVSNASGKSYSYPTVLTCTKYVPMFEKKDFTSEATVIDASKTSPTSIGMAAKVPSTELIYQRSSPGQRDGNDVETDIYKCIDGMRISGKECRKTALSYSLLVYAALRGSISIGQEHSPEFTEIAQTINDSDHVLVSSIKKILDSKLVPRFLTKVDNLTYSPRDNVVVKSVIHSFGKKFKTCLLKFGSFDILFDHVRFREVNTNGDLLEVDSETLAKSFFWRIQKESAFLIGQFMGKLGKEIDCKTFDSFVNILRQGKGDINFYHMDSLLDGLTKKGTNFDVFRKLPTLYDAFKRKVDNYGNTIFHYIVALYSQNKEYKTYMQHFCEKRFVLLQLENCDRYTAIDFASLLGRKEVIEIVISGASFNRQEMTDRISKMVTRGEEKLQLPNAKVDNLIKISLNNVDQGSSFDYAEIIRLIGNDSNTEAVDDAVRILDTIGRNVPIAVSAISALIGIFR